MVNFQIVSDLHIEYMDNEEIDMKEFITPVADNLILAGDIGSLYREKQLFNFIEQCCDNFKQVYYVPGNHEYYTLKFINKVNQLYKLRGILYSFEKKIPNLKILDRHYVEIDNYIIAGCTLWSNLDNNQLPKFRVRIADINTRIYNIYFKRDVEFINKMIETKRDDQQIIIITHYPPTKNIISPKSFDKFSFLYFSDLDYLLCKEKIHTWICGHIHFNFNMHTDGGTHLVGNQKGRERDNITDFSKNLVLAF
jgi:predicted phosphohydrolase